MTTLASIKKQLATLRSIVKPANSLAARLETLTDEQRDYYRYWHKRYDEWFERCKAQHDDEIEVDARPYAYSLYRYPPPKLRRDVRIALHGPDRLIPITASDDDAAKIYRDYCDE